MEQSQERDLLEATFPSLLGLEFARSADFFTLGSALLLQVPSSGDRLDVVAWSRTDPSPNWATELDPPFQLRLLAGIPQVLTGPERIELREFCQRYSIELGVPIALPIVADGRTLLGCVVLLNAPPFDLEDESFVLAWTQYKYALIQSWRPRAWNVAPVSEMALMRTLDSGHAFLLAILDGRDLALTCDRARIPHWRVRRLIERQLSELAGPHGAVFGGDSDLFCLFVLPQRMDQQHLWHQIEATLKWPFGFAPHWQNRVIRTPAELQKVLGR